MKFIYLAKRKPSFTQDAFVVRWRRHGALGMSISSGSQMAVYVQAEVLHPAPISGTRDDFDAVAYLAYKEGTRFDNATPEEAAETAMVLKDELETFAGPITPVMLMVDETVLKKGVPGGVTAFLFFNDPDAASAVATHYQKAANADRVILNRVRDMGDLLPVKPLLPHKAVVEVSAGSLEKLKIIIETSASAPWRKADVTVITREAVMWDRVS